VEEEPTVNQRYRDARRLAVRFLERLQRLGVAERLRRLRLFHRETQQRKMRLLSA
jgi:hypothetical protein